MALQVGMLCSYSYEVVQGGRVLFLIVFLKASKLGFSVVSSRAMSKCMVTTFCSMHCNEKTAAVPSLVWSGLCSEPQGGWRGYEQGVKINATNFSEV